MTLRYLGHSTGCFYVWVKSDNICLNKLLLSSRGCSHHLVPCIQQHDVVFADVILSELGHLGDNEVARLIGAFKQSWLVVQNGQL